MTENNLVTENRDVDTDTIIIGIKNEESRDGIDKTNLGVKSKASKSATNKKNRLFVHPFKKLKTSSQISDH